MNESVLKVGQVLHSRKGGYDYLLLTAGGASVKVLWIGPEIPRYRYTRIVKAVEVEKAYQVIEGAAKAGYKADKESRTGWTWVGEAKVWLGKETYLEHRKAIEAEVKK